MVPSGIVAVASLLVGCLLQPDGSGDEQPKVPGTPDPLNIPTAYYMLNEADARDEAWPEGWENYDVFVCTPSFEVSQLSQAQADRPDAKFLAYTSVADIHLGMYSGTYWSSLEAVFDSSLCAIDLWRDRVIRMGTGDPTYPPIPYFVINQQSADILVEFHRDVTMAAGFDGLYLDNCTAEVPQRRIDDIFSQTTRVDVNGDRVGDDATAIRRIYAAWRPYYTEQLRAAIGDDLLLVGNSGGPLADPHLNGITLEGVGDRFDVLTARGYFDDQAAVSHSPFMAVAWATTVASEAPSWELAPEVPGLHYGYIITGR